MLTYFFKKITLFKKIIKYTKSLEINEIKKLLCQNIIFQKKTCLFFSCDSLLVMASVRGSIELVLLFLEHGYPVDEICSMGDTTLYIACVFEDIEMIELLLAYKANPNKFTKYGSSCLFKATEKGNEKIIKLLLSKEAVMSKNELE